MAMRKSNAFCSICTLNYSAYAATLNDSLRKVGHTEPHYVLIVDPQKKHNHILKKFHFIPIFIDELKIPHIDELVKKYNAFELSNVLKPYFISWPLRNHQEINYLIYLDTDIYVYSRVDNVCRYLDQNDSISIVITPHINQINNLDAKNYDTYRLILLAGQYNGGFYALKNNNNSLLFLKWQYGIISQHGYNAPTRQMFVDQRILDLAPSIFNFVGIYRDISYNVGDRKSVV